MTKKGSIYGEEDNLVIFWGKGGGEGYVSTLGFFFLFEGKFWVTSSMGGEEGGGVLLLWPTVKKQCLHSVT